MGITSFINNLNDSYDYLILEVGVDALKGMDKFLELFTPDISIITGFAPQHLATFKTLENIINEKMKLAYATKEKVYINGEFKDHIKVYKNNFSFYNFNDIKVLSDYEFEYKNIVYKTNIFGTHLWLNLLPVIDCSLDLKTPLNLVKKEIQKIRNYEHRFEPQNIDNGLLIDDSYNSNYYSFLKSISYVSSLKGYKILITPGLIELGDKSYIYNTDIALKAKEIFDLIILVGKNKAFKENLKSSENFRTFLNFNDSLNYAKNIKYYKIILIENDLPDVYIE